MKPIRLEGDATARSFARCRTRAIDLARQVRPSQRHMTQRHRPRLAAATSVDDDDDEVRVQTRDTRCARVQAITNTNTISRDESAHIERTPFESYGRSTDR